MDIHVALRGRVLGKTITYYELRHHRGDEDGHLSDFANDMTGHEVRHYEVHANGEKVLHVSVALGFVGDLMRKAISYAMKVGRAIPNRWDGGLDVLVDVIDLLMSNLVNEFEDHMSDPADFRVHSDPRLHNRPGLRGDIRHLKA
ncbi:hypothetical protein CBR_g41576 [Chara braunii]|uniref:Uncharacterized protein n=1 Tax=Chara braunii TaxID=69332 RepID=A0A388K2X5_CHABU|nr:hypothetical protein CBR_g41576 [Chara braunii]|eukprot:GBG64375.1 hypothetical protein CBR_g41576 [Chara braunii]